MAGRCQEISATGTVNLIANEIPTGLINSLNTDFELLNTPIVGTVEIYLNGILQAPGLDYTISGKDITFTKAPRTNSELLASYAKA
jgi:hypothetical protein